jgi:hypothetical protein
MQHTLATNTPMTDVANSGAELPAAMNVAPDTSSPMPSSAQQDTRLKKPNYIDKLIDCLKERWKQP